MIGLEQWLSVCGQSGSRLRHPTRRSGRPRPKDEVSVGLALWHIPCALRQRLGPALYARKMLRNYFITAMRHLWRLKGYTLINVLGLAVGIAACAFTLLFVRHELSYDRFHEDAERIFRIATESEWDGRTEGSAYIHMPVATALGQLPEIEALTQIQDGGRRLARRSGESFYVEDISTAGEDVFDVFDFDLLRGSPESALVDPFSLVVTEELGRALFGDVDPIGRTINLDDSDYTVTGILAPVPAASHWRFEGLISHSTIPATTGAFYERMQRSWFAVTTIYVRLTEVAAAPALETKLNELMSRVRPDNTQPKYRLFLQPLTGIHLHSNLKAELSPPGDIATLYTFATVGILILLIACINYMNLATAKSTRRAREIGLRKLAGAKRRQLVGQLLGESVLTSLFAAALAVVLLELAPPVLGGLVGLTFNGGYAGEPWILAGVFGLAILVGILAGSYPAFFLSSLVPISMLRDRPMSGRHGGLRKALVVSQFVVSIAFIAATGVVYDQLSYIQNKDVGFDREHIVSIEQQGESEVFVAQYPTIKQELLRLSNVTSVTASMGQPGVWSPENTLVPAEEGDAGPTGDDGVTGEAGDGAGSIAYSWLATDFDFLETFGIELVAGRDLDPARGTDSTDAILINETAAEALGFDDPLGHRLKLGLNDKTGTIVGVVGDFHHESLRQPIRPTLMYATDFYFYSNVYVKVTGSDLPQTLSAIEGTWKAFFPDQPVEYAFHDDAFDAQYVEERRVARTAGLVSLIAVFVACLGLFGLASFASEQRTREIGIRKVMGATISSVVALLSKDFLKLVVVAFVVAAPLAWFFMNKWLESFAFHIEPGVETFVAAAVIAVVIALLAVSVPAARAAIADPVNALRHE